MRSFSATAALLCCAIGVCGEEGSSEVEVGPTLFHNRTEVMAEEDKGATVKVPLAHHRFGYDDPIEWESGQPLKPHTNDELEFELTSDKVATMEVVLFVAHRWEQHVRISIRSAEDSDDDADPHVLSNAECSHFTDDCVHQRFFQYTLPPLVSRGSKYRNRLAFRVNPASRWLGSSLKGKWAVKISNSLPEEVDNAYVKLVIKQSTRSFQQGVIQGFVIIFLSMCIILLAGDYLHAKIYDMSIIRPEDAAPQSTFNMTWANFEGALSRGQTAVRAGVSERYARMREVATRRGAAEDAQGSEPSVPNAAAEEEDDEEFCCRICRSTYPREDLFSPCDCAGSMRYIHRSCLEEWREKTTSEVNKKKCSECKAPFTLQVRHEHARYEFAFSAILHVSKVLCILASLEALLLMTGWAFKFVVGVATNELANIVWDIDIYHHAVALTILLAFVCHYMLLADILRRAVPNPILKILVLVLSLVVEVFAGHVGQFLLWVTGSALWDWQVHFCTGFLVVYIYVVVLHGAVANAFNKWKLRRRVERVVEDTPNEGEEGGDDATPSADEETPPRVYDGEGEGTQAGEGEREEAAAAAAGSVEVSVDEPADDEEGEQVTLLRSATGVADEGEDEEGRAAVPANPLTRNRTPSPVLETDVASLD